MTPPLPQDRELEDRATAGAEPGKRPADATQSPDEAWTALAELDRELNRLQRSIRLTIQTKLNRLAGRSLGTLQANRKLARSIHTLLDSHGLRVRCNECGHPAILRVSPRRGSTAGAFVFDHSIDGRRTFHGGGGQMPELRLTAKPARRPRKAVRQNSREQSGTKDLNQTGVSADRATP